MIQTMDREVNHMECIRKLSSTIQLSDPDDYEGKPFSMDRT